MVTEGLTGTYGGFDPRATGGIFIPGTGTRISSGEFVHSGPTRRSWTFQWQAPATDAVYAFIGVGQACDANGDTESDSWNYYDPNGRHVDDLVSDQLPAGRRVSSWDGRSKAGAEVARSVYLLRLRTDWGTSAQRGNRPTELLLSSA